jgi:hypothetical protein
VSETASVEDMTRDELDALLGGLMFVNAYYGDPPDPPTPGMTARAKLERSRRTLLDDGTEETVVGDE